MIKRTSFLSIFLIFSVFLACFETENKTWVSVVATLQSGGSTCPKTTEIQCQFDQKTKKILPFFKIGGKKSGIESLPDQTDLGLAPSSGLQLKDGTSFLISKTENGYRFLIYGKYRCEYFFSESDIK